MGDIQKSTQNDVVKNEEPPRWYPVYKALLGEL
jgi:hypothetical protein